MSNDDFFTNAFNALSRTEFSEVPVSLEEFCTSPDYLDIPPLSEIQYTCIKASSQIYKLHTLEVLYGPEEAAKIYKQTCNEIILQLGKGSGKDYISAISCCYIVYLLLCLKDPAKYYGKPPGDAIDIINIAINAVQAREVFFRGLRTRIERAPWFVDKYTIQSGKIEFDKNITVHSGHSEREAFEGYNVIAVILDEISGFAMESLTGNDLANTAKATYDMYRHSVNSRFAEVGKLILLSWPRFKNDFIQQRYDAVIAEKDIILKTHTYKRDPDLEDGLDFNEFEIKWEEDHIVRYLHKGVFALKRPTWDVNPIKHINDAMRDFDEEPDEAYGRIACMPTNVGEDNFFKNKEAIDNSFVTLNGVDQYGTFLNDFKPKHNMKYYIHVDLAQTHDRCAVAMAHVDSWVQVSIGGKYREAHPVVIIDAVRYWTPTAKQSVNFDDVRDYIIGLRRRGFDIALATFDRWQSHDMINYLKLNNIPSEVLSVAKKHYDDYLSVMYGNRLYGPSIELLKDELKELKLIKDKVDHPRSGSKDLADATCGAIFNAVSLTLRPEVDVVEVYSLADLRRKATEERQEARKKFHDKQDIPGLIRPPVRKIPDDLREYLEMPRILGELRDPPGYDKIEKV